MDEPLKPTYYSTVDEIYHCEAVVPILARQELLRRSIRRLWPQGHPTRLVQVAGTAGKGSTCRFLEMGLGCFGRSGAFSSPEVFDYRERFSVGGAPVAREEVTAAWQSRVKPLAVELALGSPGQVLFFHEVNILLALVLFEQHGVEWAAVETAVGGRYDQTTALDAAATVLTNVGADHEEELGPTPWQRALDKAGIARRGVPFFTAETEPALLALIAGVCAEAGAPFHAVGAAEVAALGELMAAAAPGGPPPEALLSAARQQRNAALALAVIRELFPRAEPPRIVAELLSARLPGRFWKVEERLYADIAHNPDKVAALAEEVERRFAGLDKIFVVGVTRGRPARAVLAPLVKLARVMVVTRATLDGQDPQQVEQAIAGLGAGAFTLVVPEPQKALAVARAMCGERDVVVVAGDMDMLDEALNPDPFLRHLNATVGWRTRAVDQPAEPAPPDPFPPRP
jgi:dihydrofolate synthase/folylpolyglutamate synthase